MTEEINEEQMEKLQEAWNWASNDLAEIVVAKEKEAEVELFFPLLMVCVDALRMRGMSPEDITENVSMRLEVEIEDELENAEVEG